MEYEPIAEKRRMISRASMHTNPLFSRLESAQRVLVTGVGGGFDIYADSRPRARHLERDLDTVIAGLSQPWNSGVVEDHVNRIKMLKRQMFGRAGFELLRKRVLPYS
ncbi:hypothetical protein OG936_26875 [Streptomyces sp. NBC_00846]|uniref:hypothetical protein n=1 Tax=Streptomyces sp. NBC_00846 TaxID=2975849 RepID=UPI00386B65C5|nr:hypothetical protein OG936_26875 [Streptomyces sp. NBC_00846]